MRLTIRSSLLPLVISLVLSVARTGVRAESTNGVPFLDLIHAPEGLRPATNARPVIVAIVDDAVRISHKDLAPFIWHNPREIPGNGVDDDGNGFVDDVTGWDVANGSADVSPPAGREDMFYHGTHLAGIVAQIARKAYGDDAPRWIRILPVKCLANDASVPYLKDGYRGIQYAVACKADIILTAWGVPHAHPDELRILQSAEDAGIMVVASAGNYPQEQEQFPAAFAPVLAVAAVDSTGVKTSQSNYGNFVDLVAPGGRIQSAGATADTAIDLREGTSVAAAVVAGAAAVVKLQHPNFSAAELLACLKNTAEPVEQFQSGDIFLGGKLGSGRLNLAAAARYDLRTEPSRPNVDLRRHQGYLASYRPGNPMVLWRIRPEGEVAGFWFEPKWERSDPGNAHLKLFKAGAMDGPPFLDLKLSEWKERRYVPGLQAMALYEPDTNRTDFKFLAEYSSKSIDQSVLYCTGTVKVNTEGFIEDGSGPADYSPRTNCKWLITAPAGKVIHVKFLEFDTEANTDWVYFFDGAGTHEKIMAAFSGPRIPPELTTWRNETLLWFVTNDSRQGKGWKAQISFVDPPPRATKRAETNQAPPGAP